MEIVGIGTQIVDCAKVRKLIDQHGEAFLMQVFTEREIRFCNGRTHVTEHYTSIWAAKEAVLRSLGTKWRRGMDWKEIEVVRKQGQTPVVKVKGSLEEMMIERGALRCLVSMAHCRTFATSTSIAVK
jgi:holo-[acyl-carrier protein] synthase